MECWSVGVIASEGDEEEEREREEACPHPLPALDAKKRHATYPASLRFHQTGTLRDRAARVFQWSRSTGLLDG